MAGCNAIHAICFGAVRIGITACREETMTWGELTLLLSYSFLDAGLFFWGSGLNPLICEV